MKHRILLSLLLFSLSACSLISDISDIFPIPTPAPEDAEAACPDVPAVCLPIICGATPTPTPTPVPTPTPAPTPPPPAGAGKIGQDYLGIMSLYWNVEAMKQALATLTGPIPTGSLLDSFGLSEANHLALFQTGKTHKHRVHLLNSTCVTNNNCGNGDKLRGYSWGALENEAKTNGSRLNVMLCQQANRVRNWAAQFPNIEFVISPLLEHHLSRTAATNVFNNLRACVGPSYRFADSHQQAYADIPGTIREQHGSRAIAPINSLDGNSVEDQNVVGYITQNSGAEFTYLWARSYNCRLETGNFIQPNLRKECPTADQFLWYLLLQAPPDPVPAQRPAWCPVARPLIAPALWKTAAENYGTGEVRSNKPVYINRSRQAQTSLYASNGILVGYLRFYGSYSTAGYFRSYLGTGSGHTARTLAEKARQVSGSSWIYIQEPGACWLVDALRRSPYYHD